jgi:DNA-binding CsgD family transcriptional regulator
MLNDRSHYRHDAERLGRVLTRLGEAAQEDSTSEQLAEVAVRLLHEELGHAYSLVWSTRPPGRRLLASRGIRADNCLVVPLEIAGETLGILETDPVDGRETLASIAPLLALALRQRLDREAIPAPEGQFPSEWKLTKRQREVAELVLGGRSNAFVAASLGCSVATVEEHLTAIFGKAGVDGRQLLAARLSAFRKAPGR